MRDIGVADRLWCTFVADRLWCTFVADRLWCTFEVGSARHHRTWETTRRVSPAPPLI
ncbi:hypothetical protein GCM10009661_60200 [Catellatospora chokoriensis]|uniref:Uncharacterized protein n=1 Tax=Catellatospora chokoriensis TaxID=310353 RepID=A0A8J3NUJ6_9ACTN|nr:hypothetical protein Cch02nite_65310 [Catellatospora chokoriensis]